MAEIVGYSAGGRNQHEFCTGPGMIFRGGNLVAAASLIAGVLIPEWAGAFSNANIHSGSKVCKTAIAQVEFAMRLPVSILQAISLAESGRWDKTSRSKFAWSWTDTARGKGRFYPSKEQAIVAVRQLKAEGVRNIDVGCMQINLMYHPKAFGRLEQAFDPGANARYAGRLFSKLRRANKSIMRAIAHYLFNHPRTEPSLYAKSDQALEPGTPPPLRGTARKEARRLAGRAGAAQGGKGARPEIATPRR